MRNHWGRLIPSQSTALPRTNSTPNRDAVPAQRLARAGQHLPGRER